MRPRRPSSSGRRALLKVGIVLGAAFAALQIVPARRLGFHVEEIAKNPPERFTIAAPPAVLAILHRACWNCHTNETKWPLYARIAPISWLLAYDVHNARNHLNLSKWGEVDEEERQADREDISDQVQSGNMPPRRYIYPMHLDARLSDADKVALKSWAANPR